VEANLVKHVSGVMSAESENPARLLSLDRKWSYTIAVAGFALLTVAGAKGAVPVPGSPVPGTLQTLPVLLAGLLLGPRLGALSQAAYLLLGMAGLPVFALPGAGPAYLLGPTGGYLLGFVAAPWIAGTLAPPVRTTRFPRRLAAVIAGILAIHAAGVAWLTLFYLPASGAVSAGSLPFLAFDVAKGILACALAGAAGAVSRIVPWTSRIEG
jgi:biotin transport system substrate-specific component